MNKVRTLLSSWAEEVQRLSKNIKTVHVDSKIREFKQRVLLLRQKQYYFLIFQSNMEGKY